MRNTIKRKVILVLLSFIAALIGSFMAAVFVGFIPLVTDSFYKRSFLHWFYRVLFSTILPNMFFLTIISFKFEVRDAWKQVTSKSLFKLSLKYAFLIYFVGFLLYFIPDIPKAYEQSGLPAIINGFAFFGVMGIVVMLPSIIMGGLSSIFSLYYLERLLNRCLGNKSEL